ncbi:hypothetical protein [Oceaniglobus ichthyenteri]|uniref:hypothetical protein n=1 Tax=Oceaniglobus ichthyenteri TaxID=2136177 RepID=UPI000D3D4ABA|nr:hypothetical protein [Oceaniglobus ichthyenteri]
MKFYDSEKPKANQATPLPARNNSLRNRLAAEAMIRSGQKNNEPTMIAAGKKLLQQSQPKTPPK